MSEINNRYKADVIVVGAGPVGLFAVFELGMLKINCHVIDTLDFVGGQCSALYPEKPIYDIPGYPKILAQDLVNNLMEQIKPFKPIFHLGEQVVAVMQNSNSIFIRTSKGKEIEAKALVIAAGAGAFGPNRPPLTAIEEYEKSSVLYMVGKREQFRDKTVVIAGGGDSALDWTISLAELAKKIYLVHRRDKFRAAPESYEKVKRLAQTNVVELVIPYQLQGLAGTNGVLKEVIVADLDGNERSLEADYLLPFFGLSMELGPIADWGLDIDHKHILVDSSTMRTSAERIYAIGDIASYSKKLKLILTGFSEAAFAAYDIYNLVYPDVPLHFEYSTTKGV